ncbi:MAG: ABC transporter substrate-binding protein, partial [Actinobacteria bacterium]|nr:ABC transporter substrate-binding protein [Actinomycetota bacterium]
SRGDMKRPGVLAVALWFVLMSACTGDQPAGDPRYGERDPGSLTVGLEVPFEPFEYEVDETLTGFDVDLIQAIADEIDLEVNFVETDFEDLIDKVSSGELDVAASAIRITDERAEKVGFVGPYYVVNQALVVTNSSSSRIGSAEDLSQQDSVVVQDDTTGKDWAEANLEPRGIEIQVVADASAAYASLEAGDATALISDEASAVTEVNNRSGLSVVQTIDTTERYGIAVNPQLSDLLDAMKGAYQTLIEDGTYDRIYEKYPGLAPNGSVTRPTRSQPSP